MWPLTLTHLAVPALDDDETVQNPWALRLGTGPLIVQTVFKLRCLDAANAAIARTHVVTDKNTFERFIIWLLFKSKSSKKFWLNVIAYSVRRFSATPYCAQCVDILNV